MSHFSEEVFADHVRGINLHEHQELQSHLASQCAECTQSFEVWHQLRAIGARENTYCSPADRVRMIKFEFDSFSQPALAGVRSAGAAAARQMVYEAEGLMVDLRFDRPTHSKCISL